MKRSDIFKAELMLIDNKFIADKVADILDTVVPEYFWYIPASSTGKYHSWYSLGYGGLVRHTKAAVKIASDLLVLEQYQDLPKDYILSALILHDTFKHGKNFDTYVVFEHPLIAVDEVLKSVSGDLMPDFLNICNLMASHMGQWNTFENKELLPKPENKAQEFVHLCDFLASRRYITVEVV